MSYLPMFHFDWYLGSHRITFQNDSHTSALSRACLIYIRQESIPWQSPDVSVTCACCATVHYHMNLQKAHAPPPLAKCTWFPFLYKTLSKVGASGYWGRFWPVLLAHAYLITLIWLLSYLIAPATALYSSSESLIVTVFHSSSIRKMVIIQVYFPRVLPCPIRYIWTASIAEVSSCHNDCE